MTILLLVAKRALDQLLAYQGSQQYFAGMRSDVTVAVWRRDLVNRLVQVRMTQQRSDIRLSDRSRTIQVHIVTCDDRFNATEKGVVARKAE